MLPAGAVVLYVCEGEEVRSIKASLTKETLAQTEAGQLHTATRQGW